MGEGPRNRRRGEEVLGRMGENLRFGKGVTLSVSSCSIESPDKLIQVRAKCWCICVFS